VKSLTCIVCREKRELLGEDEPICPDCLKRLSAIAATREPSAAVGNAPITVPFPEKVRRQLKILAAEEGRSIESMVGEAFSLLFAKYGKAEIAPVKGLEPPAGQTRAAASTGRNLPADAEGVCFSELLEKVRDALVRAQEGSARDDPVV
jgi:plasmid stability protein